MCFLDGRSHDAHVTQEPDAWAIRSMTSHFLAQCSLSQACGGIDVSAPKIWFLVEIASPTCKPLSWRSLEYSFLPPGHSHAETSWLCLVAGRPRTQTCHLARVVPFRPLTLEDCGIKIPSPWQLPFTFSTYSTWDLFPVSYLLFQDCVWGFVSVHCMAFFWAPSPTLIHTYPSHSCHPREKVRRWSSTQMILDLQIPFLPAAEGV